MKNKLSLAIVSLIFLGLAACGRGGTPPSAPGAGGAAPTSTETGAATPTTAPGTTSQTGF